MKRLQNSSFVLSFVLLIALSVAAGFQASGQSSAQVYQDIGGSDDFNQNRPIFFDFDNSFGDTGWPFYWYSSEAWTETDFTWECFIGEEPKIESA